MNPWEALWQEFQEHPAWSKLIVILVGQREEWLRVLQARGLASADAGVREAAARIAEINTLLALPEKEQKAGEEE